MTITKDQLKKILGFEDCELTIWQDGTALNFTHIEVKGERPLMDDQKIREAFSDWVRDKSNTFADWWEYDHTPCDRWYVEESYLAGYKAAYASLKAENERMLEVLGEIGEKAHHGSTGPTVPDILWEIRNLAYNWEMEE